MKTEILDQLARNTRLLPKEMAEAILAGAAPPIEKIVMHLLIAVQDAHAVVVGDPESNSVTGENMLQCRQQSAVLPAHRNGQKRWLL